MTDKNQTEATLPDGSDEAQQDVAKATDAKAEATGTSKASDELSDDDLEAVAGGRGYGNVVGGPRYDPSAPVRARQPPGR
jgi:hypothetical protein